jgi:hypothetical protein
MAAECYDIFISYPRRPAVLRWVERTLQPMLQEKLDVAGLGGTASIFRDAEAIEPGDLWKDELAEALARSKVMVAVLCAPYFESAWCTSEWTTACARDALLRASNPTRPSMIIPVRYNDMDDHDERRLPQPLRDQVRERQRLDLFPFSEVLNPLADTDSATKFRTEIASLCSGPIKRAIENAPEYSERWPRLPAEPPLVPGRGFRATMGRPR